VLLADQPLTVKIPPPKGCLTGARADAGNCGIGAATNGVSWPW
jgi:hypothetical protein